jgi:hypothetical protein
MAVELAVVCPERPDSEQVAWLVGPLISMILHCPLVHALADDDGGVWTVHWDSVSAVVDQLPPGRHEFANNWVLTAAAGERGIDLSLLLTIVTAAAIAITVEGRIIDDASLVGGGSYSGGELLVRAAGGPERSVTDALKALGSPSWGE